MRRRGEPGGTERQVVSGGRTWNLLRLGAGVPFAGGLRGAADEAVADADDRLDAIGAVAQLLAQPADVNVERARVAVILMPPHFVEKLGAGCDPPGPARERGQQRELFAREPDLGPVAQYAHALRVDLQPVVLVVRSDRLF